MENTINSETQVYRIADKGKRIVAGLIDAFTIVVGYGFIQLVITLFSLLIFSTTGGLYSSGSDLFASGALVDSNSLSALMAGQTIIVALISMIGAAIIFVFVYVFVASSIFKGQTFGKKLFGLKVIKSTGHEVVFADLLKRHLIGLSLLILMNFPLVSCCIYCFGPIYVIGNIVKFLSDNMGKSIGDTIADTVVIEA